MTQQYLQVNFDRALSAGSALSSDKLGRLTFVKSLVQTLNQVPGDGSIVISVEGSWGSGKTSVLNMAEEMLLDQRSAPVIVKFNPWLIGDRNSLLREFLSAVAKAVELTDHAKNGSNVAKQLKAYAGAFDLVKLIPGAEPLASIVKGVISAAGDTVGSIAEHKALDIVGQKKQVEDALRKFERTIVVFIDDIDRLFPLEVFEMIRIIKSVGELPSVGYVVAWDRDYVSKALSVTSVPKSEEYLDKIVQIRMALPRLTSSAKEKLVDEAIRAFPVSAVSGTFPEAQERLEMIYFLGLRDVLEQPRDIIRVFNIAGIIGPELRGEVVFADIVGLCTLMIKAPQVYDLLRNNPRIFVGKLPSDRGMIEKSDVLIRQGDTERSQALDNSSSPVAVRRLVNTLFPMTSSEDDSYMFSASEFVKGHIGDPARLQIALQMELAPEDVSLRQVSRFLQYPDSRSKISCGLTSENCFEFIDALGIFAIETGGKFIDDVLKLSVNVAELIDRPPFTTRERKSILSARAEQIARSTICKIIKSSAEGANEFISAAIARSESTLTISADILRRSFSDSGRKDDCLVCDKARKEELTTVFAQNVLAAAKANKLSLVVNPGYVLFVCSLLAPNACPEIFNEIRKEDATLDWFAIAMFTKAYDSVKGRSFAIPVDTSSVEAYIPFEKLVEHAKDRLKDIELGNPGRAVWRSIVEGKNIYAVDGSERLDF